MGKDKREANEKLISLNLLGFLHSEQNPYIMVMMHHIVHSSKQIDIFPTNHLVSRPVNRNIRGTKQFEKKKEIAENM